MLIIVIAVLPPRNLCHTLHNTHPAIPHQSCTMQDLQPATANILSPQIILLTVTRFVSECTRNPQLFAFVHHWSALRAVEFCANSIFTDDAEIFSCWSCIFSGNACCATCIISTCYSSSGMQVYGYFGAGGSVAGCVWLGCMGCVDAGCGVVRVVAGLDDGCCVGW